MRVGAFPFCFIQNPSKRAAYEPLFTIWRYERGTESPLSTSPPESRGTADTENVVGPSSTTTTGAVTVGGGAMGGAGTIGVAGTLLGATGVSLTVVVAVTEIVVVATDSSRGTTVVVVLQNRSSAHLIRSLPEVIRTTPRRIAIIIMYLRENRTIQRQSVMKWLCIQ